QQARRECSSAHVPLSTRARIQTRPVLIRALGHEMEVQLSALTLIFRIGRLPRADREIALTQHLGHQPPEVFQVVDWLFIDLGDDGANLDAGQLRQAVADPLEDRDAFGRAQVQFLADVLSDRPDDQPELLSHRDDVLLLLVRGFVRRQRHAFLIRRRVRRRLSQADHAEHDHAAQEDPQIMHRVQLSFFSSRSEGIGSMINWSQGATAFCPLRSLFSPFQTAKAAVCMRPGPNAASLSGSRVSMERLNTTLQRPCSQTALPCTVPCPRLLVSVLKPPPKRSSTEEARRGMTSKRRICPSSPPALRSSSFAFRRSISVCQSAFQCQMFK